MNEREIEYAEHEIARLTAENKRLRKERDTFGQQFSEACKEIERLRDEVRWHETVVEVLNEDVARPRRVDPSER